MRKSRGRNVACFISPHGLGHAARAAATLAALQRLQPDINLHLFTTAPKRFFTDSGCRKITLHDECADVGFVQHSALVADLPATVDRLDEFLPFHSNHIELLAETVRRGKCGLVLCDIAPLGIAVARQAGLPSVLVENFMWDDLYQAYVAAHPRLAAHIDALHGLFSQASLHIQTQPVCKAIEADLTVGPVSRPPRQSPSAIRKTLSIGADIKIVLMTMGGVSGHTPLLESMAHRKDIVFIVAWGSAKVQRSGNIIGLPLQSDFYHPDLVHAADAVIGKVGYSTLSEVYHAGVPFGYIVREGYPEMPPLVDFIEKDMAGFSIPAATLNDSLSENCIDRLLSIPRRPPTLPNGADPIANFLLPLLRRTP